MNRITITIITATLNAAHVITDLASDLLEQTDRDYRWLIVDGGSSDGTIEALPADVLAQVDLLREKDFGIYDALNKGVRRCTTSHYLVVGADDRLAPDAIAGYRRLAEESDADIVAASVRDAGRVALPGRGRSWLRGQNAFISHHSVGTLIRRSLHETVGFYSKNLPIAADQLFIKTAIQHGCRVRYAPHFIAGEFSRDGVSSTRYLATLFEFTLVQLRTERRRGVQLAILVLRLLRHWRKALA